MIGGSRLSWGRLFPMSRSIRLLVLCLAAGLALVVPSTAATAAAPLEITTSTLPTSYSYVKNIPFGGKVRTTLKAKGGTAPYKWAVVGSLPRGFALSTAGTLTGNTGRSGTYAVTARVTDKTGVTAERSWDLVVKPMVITTASVKNAKKGQLYYATLKSVGGCSAPRWDQWVHVPGSLPPGLKVSRGGAISGIAKVPGTYTFTVWADCEVNPLVFAAATKQFTMTVA